MNTGSERQEARGKAVQEEERNQRSIFKKDELEIKE
jgi:hypothetical protein